MSKLGVAEEFHHLFEARRIDNGQLWRINHRSMKILIDHNAFM